MKTAIMVFAFGLLIAAIWVSPPLGLRIMCTLAAINGAIAVTIIVNDSRRTAAPSSLARKGGAPQGCAVGASHESPSARQSWGVSVTPGAD